MVSESKTSVHRERLPLLQSMCEAVEFVAFTGDALAGATFPPARAAETARANTKNRTAVRRRERDITASPNEMVMWGSLCSESPARSVHLLPLSASPPYQPGTRRATRCACPSISSPSGGVLTSAGAAARRTIEEGSRHGGRDPGRGSAQELRRHPRARRARPRGSRGDGHRAARTQRCGQDHRGADPC